MTSEDFLDTLVEDEGQLAILSGIDQEYVESTLLQDDLNDLYLECEEDDLYTLPQPKDLSSPAPSQNPTVLHLSIPLPELPQERRHSCDLCCKDFTRPSLLLDHKCRVHGLKGLFSCSVCAYTGDLYRHFMKHVKRKHPGLSKESLDFSTVKDPSTGEKAMTSCDSTQAVPNTRCSECGKDLLTAAGLKNHMRLSHGPRRYHCSLCQKSFTCKQHLTFHQARIHEKRFQCSVKGCAKSFRDRWNLETHLQIHSGIKTKHCSLCTYKCVQKAALDYHIKAKHNR